MYLTRYLESLDAIKLSDYNLIVSILGPSGKRLYTKKTRYFTLLIAAIKTDNFKILKLLLDRLSKKMFKKYDHHQETLLAVVKQGNYSMLKLMLDYFRVHFARVFHYPYIMIAAIQGGNYDVVKILFDNYTIDLNSLSEFILYDILEAVMTVDIPDISRLIINSLYLRYSRDILICSIIRKNTKMVKLLLENGADPNVSRDAFALEIACDIGLHDIVVLLLNTKKITAFDSSLSYAVNKGNEKTVELLLEHGADPNFICGRLGYSLLFRALIQNNKKIAKLLLNAGANIYQKIDGDDCIVFNLYSKFLNVLLRDDVCVETINEIEYYDITYIYNHCQETLKVIKDYVNNAPDPKFAGRKI